jgi:hypothetical protein
MKKEFEKLFDKKFSDLDKLNEEHLDKEQVLQLVNYIVTHFAHIWCTKPEIIEMRKRVMAMFENEDIKRVSKFELFEIFDVMLTTIRILHMTKSKFKEFERDHHGVVKVDEAVLVDLVDWMLKSYERSGLHVKADDNRALHESIIANYESKGSAFLGIRELSLFFEKALEVCI